MRRALSSSQMAPPGKLPCTHAHMHMCTHTVHSHIHTLTRRHAYIHIYAHAHTYNPVSPCCTPNCCWLSALLTSPLGTPLPLHFSPALSSMALHPSPLPSLHRWQLLIHVAALQMSQLTSWENSRGGEERRRFERRGGVCYISVFDREATNWMKIYRFIYD